MQKLNFQKTLKNIRKNNDFCTSWEARIALRTSWGGLGPLLGALGPLLGALGPLLGDLESFLGDLETVLGRSWGLLVRSWGLLARSWVVLGVQESPGQGASVARAKRFSPPPGETLVSDPPQSSDPEGQGKRKTGLRTTGKREESGPQGRGKSQDHREDGRGKKRAPPHAQRPRGPADIKNNVFFPIYFLGVCVPPHRVGGF